MDVDLPHNMHSFGSNMDIFYKSRNDIPFHIIPIIFYKNICYETGISAWSISCEFVKKILYCYIYFVNLEFGFLVIDILMGFWYYRKFYKRNTELNNMFAFIGKLFWHIAFTLTFINNILKATGQHTWKLMSATKLFNIQMLQIYLSKLISIIFFGS